MTHPGDVPEEVVSRSPCSWTFAAASRATCTEREKTRLEHQWEIAREVGYRDFVEVEGELGVWVDDRAWMTGEGPVAVFDGAVGWFGERQVLLSGVTTLAVACGACARRGHVARLDWLALSSSGGRRGCWCAAGRAGGLAALGA
jgi:hypothetical protein